MPYVFEDEEIETEEESYALPKQYARGAAEGVGFYGDVLDLLKLQAQERLPGEVALEKAEFEAPEHLRAFYQEDDILPRFTRIASKKDITDLLKGLGLEKDSETFGEKAARRGGEITSSLLETGVFSPIRALLAGLTGEAAAESGMGPVGTFIAEALPLGLPGLGKKITPKKRQQEAVKTAREFGLKEKEIAPGLFEENWWKRQLARIAPKRGKAARGIRKSKESIGNMYDDLRSRPEAQRMFRDETRSSLEGAIEKELEDMPSKYRKQIKDDLLDFESQPKTPESAINLYQDINQTFGPKNKRTVAINEHIKNALKEDFPELSKDFDIINQLYGNNRKLSSLMKPTIASDLFGLGEIGTGVAAVMFQNYPLLIEVMGSAGARHLAGEMLTNPRLLNISKQFLSAYKNNSPRAMARLMKDYEKTIQDPKAKEVFQKWVFEEDES